MKDEEILDLISAELVRLEQRIREISRWYTHPRDMIPEDREEIRKLSGRKLELRYLRWELEDDQNDADCQFL